jgi:hypothetical protein
MIGSAAPAWTNARVLTVKAQFTVGIERTASVGVNAGVAESEEDPKRIHDRPFAWVHLVEIPRWQLGRHGRVFRLPDIIEFTS